MSNDVIILGRDGVGIVAEGYGMRYYLTDCCGASAKGSVGGENGMGATVCRSCYYEIDYALGGIPDKPLVKVFGDGITYEDWAKARAILACTEEGNVFWAQSILDE